MLSPRLPQISAGFCAALMLLFPVLEPCRASVRFDVVGSPTEVITTGQSEVTGNLNFIVRGTGNVTGTAVGGPAQIGLVYTNPALEIDNTTGSGIRLIVSAGFAPALPTIASVENRDLNGRCTGTITLNLPPGATPSDGDFIRLEGVRGRIDASAGIRPGSDLFVDIQSINDPSANNFTPDRVRVAKSFDGLTVNIEAKGAGCIIRIAEGFSRAFIDEDSANDGINSNDRADSTGAALGAPTNSTRIRLRIDGIPEGVTGIAWPAASTTFATGATLRLLASAFDDGVATATYSYESTNQVGNSDIALESFTLEPGLIVSGGIGSTDDLAVSVGLAPAAPAAAGCNAPSSTGPRPRFLDAYEPLLFSLAPSSIVKGSAGFTLSVRGSGFVSSSTLLWNGASRPTTVLSGTKLSAQIPAGDVAFPGEAQVSVLNPTQGPAASNILVFKIEDPALTMVFPRLESGPQGASATDPRFVTGFAVANLGGRIANLTFSAFDRLGNLISGPEITNPAKRTLSGGKQLPLVDSQIWGPGFSVSSRSGWAKLESDVGELAGFFLSFDERLITLDGADASRTRMNSAVLTEVLDGGFTEIHASNPGPVAATVLLELVGSNGETRAGPVSRSLPRDGSLRFLLKDLFPGTDIFPSDYVRASSDSSVVWFEFLGKSGQFSTALYGQDAAKGGGTLYCPQYVVGGPNWRSNVSIVNLSSEEGDISLRFISDDGTPIGPARVVRVAARGKVYITNQDFFVDAGNTAVQGYLEITASRLQLAGSVFFGDPLQRTFGSALPMISNLKARMVFGQVASDSTYFMGVSILNPGSTDANVRIQLYGRDGNLLAFRVVSLQAKRRITRLLTEIFPALIGLDLSSGYVDVSVAVGEGLAGFALFGTQDLTALSAIPPQDIP